MDICRDLVPEATEAELGNIQIVLAEALNNVAEHGFPGLPAQVARINVTWTGARLLIDITDHGHPVPTRLLLPPPAPRLDRKIADLPEGGFGWMLIHELTSAIQYRRVHGENRLRLIFDLATGTENPTAPQ